MAWHYRCVQVLSIHAYSRTEFKNTMSSDAKPVNSKPNDINAEEGTRLFLLYVEDDILIQSVVADDLQEAGFDLLIADSGEQALTMLADQSEVIKGVITDVNLGEGPDGWDVARTAREVTSGLPVVYVTAASEHEWTSKGVPGSLMITKPFVSAQLIVAISSLLVVTHAPQ